ncbi:hypothetical protein GCK72_021187 [Caenorhabditis remanei]|uniref:F-box domain-containing protein n=1 Tax=Caenorhabditis remanei TaxID=31234 RepID=A0A6A5GIK6_CAERE|nr:hypothetical protein GCK72_021187 [Caenorhabditis remanei]KAF1754624.1 hypothetical protein GCK72_021187 [Caenorhabditis remanei]
MVSLILNDPKYIRVCIYYEVLGNIPVCEAYKNLCKRVGNIDYVEFEFWYMRFVRGEIDLDYDRSLEPATRGLLNMPSDIMLKIINSLTAMERLVFRKTSRDILSIVDTCKLNFNDIMVLFRKDKATLNLYDSNERQYFQFRGATCSNTKIEERSCEISNRFVEKTMRNANPVDLAMSTLMVILKNTKVELEDLKIKNDSNRFDELEEMLNGLTHRLRVKNFTILTQYSKEEMMVLPYLKPGTLECLSIEMLDHHVELSVDKRIERMNKLVAMDQWKMAKYRNISTMKPVGFPIRSLLDCEWFNLKLDCKECDANTVVEILKPLFTSTVLQKFQLSTQFHMNPEEIFRKLGLKQRDSGNDKSIRYISIPNSGDYYEFSVDLFVSKLSVCILRRTARDGDRMQEIGEEEEESEVENESESESERENEEEEATAVTGGDDTENED